MYITYHMLKSHLCGRIARCYKTENYHVDVVVFLRYTIEYFPGPYISSAYVYFLVIFSRSLIPLLLNK
jgi:hypothetical protein